MGHGKIFTHHQKTVSMDAPSLDSTDKRRRVISFVGGLDLTNGRYDTPEHPLFDTLKTVHSGDFRQQLGGFDSRFGPRQPWHDCHAMVEGRAARDVVKNFEQRWRKQVTIPLYLRLLSYAVGSWRLRLVQAPSSSERPWIEPRVGHKYATGARSKAGPKHCSQAHQEVVDSNPRVAKDGWKHAWLCSGILESGPQTSSSRPEMRYGPCQEQPWETGGSMQKDAIGRSLRLIRK